MGDIMEDKLYLTDLIDVEVLQRIQDSFSEMTGMAALTADSTGFAVTKGSNFTDFCNMYTRKSELGEKRCMQCDKKGAEITLKNGEPCSYYCHAGLVDFAAPIMANGVMVGSFIGGQILTTPPDFEKIRRIALELGIDPDEYVEAIKRIKVIDKETVDKAARFLYVVSDVLSNIAYKSYELYKSNIEIEKAANMKSDFLANMSHEIRTPMNAVLGMVDLALREEMSPAAREFMMQIKASGKNLLVIINDILDFSKIESGKMDIIKVTYEPLSLVNDLANVVNSRIGNKKIEFTMDISPDIPKNLFGDNVRIHQIMLNLLTNAVKFTNEGEVHLKIECCNKDEDNTVMKVSIKDTGIGIKEENFKKLFNSFQQVDSKRNRNIEGTGLGLAITKQLLTLMHGEISLESEYNKGSTFFFELPQKVIDAAPSIPKLKKDVFTGIFVENMYVKKQIMKDLDRIGSSYIILDNNNILEKTADCDYILVEKELFSKDIENFFVNNRNKQCIVIANYDSKNDINLPNVRVIRKPVYSLNLFNALGISNVSIVENNSGSGFTFTAPEAYVLVVDDNSVNLTVTKGLIEPLKMNVDLVESAKEAIKKAEQIKYDIIFMDHMMPEIDGVEATHMIREMIPGYENVPIIALTANALSGAKEMFLKEGLNGFVAKPIELKEIISKIRKWLPPEKIIPIDKDNMPKNNNKAEEITIDIPELNVKSALEMLGSKELFMTVLKEYYSSIDKKAASILGHKQAQQWREYTIEVHALKSISKQIGADFVSQLAAEMEKAGNEGNIELINQRTDELIAEYCKYKEILSPIFASENKDEEKKTANSDDILYMLEQMQEALDNFDTLQIDEVIDEMSKYTYNEQQNEYFLKLKDLAKSSDIDGCGSVIEEWRNSLQ